MQLFHLIFLFGVSSCPGTFADLDAYYPFKTSSGEFCITPCEKRGKEFYWCYKATTKGKGPSNSHGGKWLGCSPGPGLTRAGFHCASPCENYKDRYHFCYMDYKEHWEYCGITNSTRVPRVVRQLTTVSGVNCVSMCQATPSFSPWCYKAGGGWDFCSPMPNHDIDGNECTSKCSLHDKSYECPLKKGGQGQCGTTSVSSQTEYTYAESKCLTSCQPFGSGANYCYDASQHARLCSRVQGTTVRNQKCVTRCDPQGGIAKGEYTEYFWCWTDDARTTWDYCSNVGDDTGDVDEAPRYYKKSEIPLLYTRSKAHENIYKYRDNQGENRVTFFEKLGKTGSEVVDENGEVQKWALECLEKWGYYDKFKLSHNDSAQLVSVGDKYNDKRGVSLNQESRYNFQTEEYITLQLQLDQDAKETITLAEVQTPANLLGRNPQEVIGAFLWSMYKRHIVHIGRFDYDPNIPNSS